LGTDISRPDDEVAGELVFDSEVEAAGVADVPAGIEELIGDGQQERGGGVS
jgi:hypothetical protein